MKCTQILLAVFSATILFAACGKTDDSPDQVTVEASDFSVTINENPTAGQVLGTVQGTTSQGSVTFSLSTQNPTGAFTIDTTTGVLKVANASLFDFETHPTLTGVVKVSNGGVSKNANVTVALNNVNEAAAIQSRLNNGETPIQIYNSNPALLDSLYGKTYQGGLIFYLNTGTGSGMVAAPSNQGTLNWGCEGSNISGTSTALGSGKNNTLLIVSSCFPSGIAARACDNLVLGGYSDWYLPSKDELNLMHQKLYLKGHGNFQLARYWSSSQYNAQFAWCQLFNLNLNQLYYDKDLIAYPVRAARTF